MHFCEKCDNMYYLRLSEANSNKLIHYCRNCGNEETITSNESLCLTNDDLISNDQKYKYIINKYTKLDPSLPRTNTIKCPNQSCVSNTHEGHEREIIYVRYDDANVKYIYICSTCDFTWKIDDQK